MPEAGLVISHLFQNPSPRLLRLAEKAAVWGVRRLPEPDWLAAKPKRRIFHWGLGPVLADFQKSFLSEGLDRYLAESGVELFSFDLGPSARRHLSILPLSPPLGQAAIFRQTAKAVAFIRKFYQGPLAVENYNYYPTGLYEHITEPDFIKSYLDEFGFGLVLDLAHGAVTAHNTGMRPLDYFESLPLSKVAELHISRPFLPAARRLPAVDTHLGPGPREWEWLKALLVKQIMPENTPVFIEFYKNPAGLSRHQAQLTDLVQTF
ncbi:hypothetical protein C4J81_08295 [Deltaproteobacteria bacterium Smac51]|nr:hypothetical protein C4J81_08295 [Deltaproteobacteria bacterium Smac51]